MKKQNFFVVIKFGDFFKYTREVFHFKLAEKKGFRKVALFFLCSC